MITVPKKVDVIATNPCRIGSLDLTVAVAIGALSRPASLVKIPLATPCWMTFLIVIPVIPPASAWLEKAIWTIDRIARGISLILQHINKRQIAI